MLAKVEEVVLQDKLIVSSSPHIRSNESVKRIMLDVVIALTPAIIGSVYLFGLNALKLILISVVSSVLSEALIQKLFKRPITITDFSAAITGILIAFNLPASAPWWLPVIGSAFAIIVVKQLFGGLGANFMNPALAARAMLMTSWPVHMTNYTGTRPDVVTSATPLSIMKYGTGAELPTLRDMFIGNIPGVIGETSALLLLIGAAYLIIRKVIDWKIPVFYIGTTFIMLLLLGVEPKLLPYHILGGGLILGAFYMATDYSSSPVTPLGRIIFAVGAGVLTAIIRIKGAYPEGVSYSILLMNVATPLIEKFTKPRVFGKVK
ncbi:electron transport complex, RnfABCDGE type, D subunit [Thermoanaerobacter mathranii subsp. mathranii str. A3]|uniref:Ion-translocating oxidoreductase complex subunit D n=1 Tax=Thermoanaerobacter mathranii subsp. mathranii (strain DSM 11426 / CCUG 53645 / CIP 108742 / A3) TaxID=583358 RepID=A0ABM5LMJ3_THEM3|nr:MULTISPECIES: RnfABCDGE type electron transport complex subunit D [Thermoanaerobacter]ADH59954.1 electron transport complex, RnfABCDGE type, D subunit [Thermoanaerobacter mathranii subsp. mathranii str. A3]MBT1279092.1 RnfABCDGE type electron transport complex subunit D [Thermoanaerobacter sp. CM-CNRG TB177]